MGILSERLRKTLETSCPCDPPREEGAAAPARRASTAPLGGRVPALLGRWVCTWVFPAKLTRLGCTSNASAPARLLARPGARFSLGRLALGRLEAPAPNASAPNLLPARKGTLRLLRGVALSVRLVPPRRRPSDAAPLLEAPPPSPDSSVLSRLSSVVGRSRSCEEAPPSVPCARGVVKCESGPDAGATLLPRSTTAMRFMSLLPVLSARLKSSAHGSSIGLKRQRGAYCTPPGTSRLWKMAFSACGQGGPLGRVRVEASEGGYCTQEDPQPHHRRAPA